MKTVHEVKYQNDRLSPTYRLGVGIDNAASGVQKKSFHHKAVGWKLVKGGLWLLKCSVHRGNNGFAVGTDGDFHDVGVHRHLNFFAVDDNFGLNLHRGLPEDSKTHKRS